MSKNRKGTAVLLTFALALCAAGGYLTGSLSKKNQLEGTSMTLTFTITNKYIYDKETYLELKFVRGTEAAWTANFSTEPPSFDEEPKPALWISFVENTLAGGSGPATSFELTHEQARLLERAPVDARVIITYQKLTPPPLRSSLVSNKGNVELNVSRVSSSEKYLEGWLAQHARVNFEIAIQQP